VLDEATSAIDAATDTAIRMAFLTELSKSTVIVIAHRLYTIAVFDVFPVLDGRIVEYGPAEFYEGERLFLEAGLSEGGKGRN
jgi:ABC-type multidrug transport system fused ATPase/permease subunit